LAVIDSTGVLTLIEISEDNVIKRTVNPEANLFQRRDVWTMKWASDDPELLAIMEKSRMYIIRGFNPEEPISTSAYIASFEVNKNITFNYCLQQMGGYSSTSKIFPIFFLIFLFQLEINFVLVILFYSTNKIRHIQDIP